MRLRPLTETVPKAMVLVLGKPFVDYQLRLLAAHGARKVVFCLQHLAKQIQDYVGDGSRYGLEVSYVLDGDQPMGTGGAVTKALPLVGEIFFILYGDSYLDIPSYRLVWERFQASGKDCLMTVYRNKNKGAASNVLFRDSRILMYNKKNPQPQMEHIDFGLTMARPGAFAEFPDNPFDLAEVFQKTLAKDRLEGLELFVPFFEVGSLEGISDLENHLIRRKP